jgi:hypothetical protein
LSGTQPSSHQVNTEVPVTEQGTEEEDDVDEANMEANVDRRISILEDDAPLPSSAGNKKPPHKAFSFVVDILKRFQLHFVLDVALDPMQIGAVMRFVWKSIGYMFWKHRHLKEHLCKLFPVDCLHSPWLEHDLYNPNYHQQIMVSTFVFEDNKIWSDFLEYKKGTYPKQNQRTHGFDFIPKHGLAPNVSTADAK